MDGEKPGRRKVRFELVMHERERNAIRKNANARGLSESAFVRMSALGQPLPTRQTEIEAEAVVALNRVGSNLNQIARVGNESRTLSEGGIKTLSALCKQVINISNRIQEGIQ